MTYVFETPMAWYSVLNIVLLVLINTNKFNQPALIVCCLVRIRCSKIEMKPFSWHCNSLNWKKILNCIQWRHLSKSLVWKLINYYSFGIYLLHLYPAFGCSHRSETQRLWTSRHRLVFIYLFIYFYCLWQGQK